MGYFNFLAIVKILVNRLGVLLLGIIFIRIKFNGLKFSWGEGKEKMEKLMGREMVFF